MGDDFEYFIEEQRAKLAQDKAILEKDPPYMEIKSKRFENTHDGERPMAYVSKENIPPKRQSQKETAPVKQSDPGYGMSLPLGEDYERKKHKLKEELRQDYRKYLNQGNAQVKRKKHLISTGEVDPATRGLSLPIGERLSGKERLRLERNREYNQFLRIKDDEQETYRLAAAVQFNQNDKTQSRLKAHQYSEAPVSHRDQDVPKKDSYSSMQAYEQLLNKRRAETGRPRRRDIETETEDPFVRRPEEDTKVSHNKPWRSEIEPDRMERPRYAAEDYEAGRRPLRLNLAPDSNEPLSYRGRYDEDVHDRRPVRYNPPRERVLPRHGDVLEKHEYIPDRESYFHIEKGERRHFRDRDRETPVDYEDDFREPSNRRPNTTLTRNRPKVENPVQPTDRSKSAYTKEGNFSTSLFLGDSNQDEALKRRKARYREELQEQMAEQQRNKIREKELGLKVAASGAIDPEKQPDRLRQFGAINRQQEMPDRNVSFRPGVLIDSEKTSRRVENKPVFEERAPPERPRVAFQTPVPEPAVTGSGYPVAYNPAQEDLHRGISSALGEIVAPRIAAVPPPQPPILVDGYRTPYDDAYYYYGARNPLDPNLAYYPAGMMVTQPAPGVNMPSMYPSQAHPGDYAIDRNQKAVTAKGLSLGLLPEENSRQNRQVAQSYQKELEQQIREKNEKRRNERDEQERYDAKLEAEMKSYNPWGKGGGGAPLRDGKGNLITDLKRMHKENENSYQNPEFQAFEDQRAVVAVDTSLADKTSTGKIQGFAFANPSQFARGSVFTEPPTEQQVHQQESYKNFLQQQIEEKRRKEEQEKERIRLEEEREEKRLAEERAKIQREYEEEQNKKLVKEEEQRQKNEELVRLAGERRKEAERKKKEEEAKQEDDLKRFYEQQKAANVSEEKEKFQPSRQPSPVIPALQNKLPSRTPRPPTAESEVSIKSHDEPQPHITSPPVPARRNPLRAYEEKKSVIGELSELRKQLRSEQRRLEGRLQDTDRDDESLPSRSGRRREKGSADIFDLARQRVQATVRRPSLKELENVNLHNIREFNDLKYRDTETREGVRFMYPDPPKDDKSLEIQQQALLREQQRNLNRMKRRPVMPKGFELFPEYNLPTAVLKDPTKDLLKTSLLESESAFIGENGEPYAAFPEQFPDLQALSTARERRRHQQQTVDFDNEIPHVPPLRLNQPDTFSVNSISSFNVEELHSKNEERLRRLNNFRKSIVSIDEDPDIGNADDILKRYPTKLSDRPHSVDTVATEPWMRPGTSETLKRFMAGQMNQEQATNENALTFNWQGLSTAHG
ncbi:centrosome and spindle pole-associated protein 1 isoform X2 [Rana temporaria]|uniref:centrosome and spindle pole-associated protein 1 isoform X2 n=1 Tax=Rana temporaria TaxID=8407 RepID=UPI001AACBE91|nr:centrosome and spindle pole-associated protein 1 isoform X2 [Rana temporaria]